MQLSRSLNTDYLWQLFIKANTSRLDASLVAPYITQKGLPEEAQCLLVFR